MQYDFSAFIIGMSGEIYRIDMIHYVFGPFLSLLQVSEHETLTKYKFA
jgi:hypothetical protein